MYFQFFFTRLRMTLIFSGINITQRRSKKNTPEKNQKEARPASPFFVCMCASRLCACDIDFSIIKSQILTFRFFCCLTLCNPHTCNVHRCRWAVGGGWCLVSGRAAPPSPLRSFGGHFSFARTRWYFFVFLFWQQQQ